MEMPRLGLGTFELVGRACERVVAEALALGYRHVDTAEGYGNEVEVGRALRSSGLEREQVFLTSKVWRDHLAPPLLRRQLEETLRRLRIDYLDLYLVHWPNSAVPAAETAAGMEALREEGLLRSWGVSNYTVGHLDEVLRHAQIATNQVELHPYLRQEALIRYCRRRGLLITAYTPLARGLVSQDPVLLDIARGHGRTPAQVALAWSLGQGHAVVPKASRREHLADNLAALALRLSLDEVDRIDRLPQRARIFEYKWSEFDHEPTAPPSPEPPTSRQPKSGPRAPLGASGRRASRSRSPRSPDGNE
jgi:2,5-diketo-D-gluconate reductase B